MSSIVTLPITLLTISIDMGNLDLGNVLEELLLIHVHRNCLGWCQFLLQMCEMFCFVQLA